MLLTQGKTRSIFEWARPLTGNEGWDHFDWRDIKPIFFQIWYTFGRLFNSVRLRLIDRYKLAAMYVRHIRNLLRIRY